jgi:hypothetical protein
MKTITKKNISLFTALTASALAVTVPVFAADVTTSVHVNTGMMRADGEGRGMMMQNMGPAIWGTITAVNGNTITVSGKTMGANKDETNTTAATTYTVDVTSAKITKSNVAGTVASLVTGDSVMVQGTITGTNVKATMVHDGVMAKGAGMMRGGMHEGGMMSTSSPITGNGQPVVAGKVTAISGSSITITNSSNVTYTIDATNAKITEGRSLLSLSNIVVGDSIVAQGTINGTGVVATSIIDQTNHSATTNTTTGTKESSRPGMFGGLGQFFMKIFGF